MWRLLFAFCILALSFERITPAHSQQTCTPLVETALQIVSSACERLGRNQACHGSLLVDAEPRQPDDSFRFELGDLVELTRVSAIETSPLDLLKEQWGIAVLRVQANLPDALPGQNALFVLFGSARMEDMRGRDDAPPMQAFRLVTGLAGTRCEEPPLDGLLIRTPTGMRMHFTMNGVELRVGSTIFVSAVPRESLTVATLEGEVELRTHDRALLVPAGLQAEVPLNDDAEPVGGPGNLIPIPEDLTERLPLSLLATLWQSNAGAVVLPASSLPTMAAPVVLPQPVIQLTGQPPIQLPALPPIGGGNDNSDDDDDNDNGSG